jgi:hypothetical protein
VPECVVDLLEPVEVHEQHGGGGCGLQTALEALVEVQTVGQTRQRVVKGEVLGLPRRIAYPFHQRAVRERDRGVTGQRAQKLGVFGVECAHVVDPVGDGEDADDAPGFVQRSGHGVDVTGALQPLGGLAVAAAGQAHHIPVQRRSPPGGGVIVVDREDLGSAGAQERAGLAEHSFPHRPVQQ